MRYILIVIMSVSILLTGCSEKPERQAAKDIRKSAEKARDSTEPRAMQSGQSVESADHESFQFSLWEETGTASAPSN